MLETELHPVRLSRGLIDEHGRRHLTAWLRPMTGFEEASLGQFDGTLAAQTTSNLLSRCVARIGEYHEVDTTHVAALSRGDRQRLLLELRAMMAGDRLLLSVRCPNPACAELSDLTMSIHDVVGEIEQPEAEWFEVDGLEGRIRFRPPTGADDELCELESGLDREQKAALLFGRLLEPASTQPAPDGNGWPALSAETRRAVASRLALHRSPDLLFVSRCTTCAALMELLLDPLELLCRELRLGARRLIAEVHALAFHYGWQEDQILGLPRERRWTYLDLLRRQLNGSPLVDGW